VPVEPEDLTQVFEEEFARAPSSIEEDAAVAALGEEYPSGLETYSWVSRTELRQVADQVPREASLVVDLGCGRGGPGLWVAAAAGVRLIGLDVAGSALSRARAQAERLDVEAEFRLGSFEDSGLPDASADLVMSFDAFLFAADKQAAFHELARLLRPGGRLAMTSWDYHTQPRNRPPQIPDHRPLAEAAGLRVLRYDDTDDWRNRCVVFADFLLDRAEALAQEAGAPVEEVLADLADMRDSIDCMTRRFLLVAQRP
jgi:SAM-dependent methyltransferase